MRLHIGVDVGGTFTDFVISESDTGRSFLWKRPSVPGAPDQAIVGGLGEAFAAYELDAGDAVQLAHGTTVGTNALIERRFGRVAVVTTEGFRDLLEIGRQVRPKVYDLHLDNPPPLVSRELRFEVRERRLANGDELRPLDERGLSEVAAQIARLEVDCVAVCFLHAHAFPDHERAAVEMLRRSLGPKVRVIASSDVYPEFREYERFSTTVLNAVLLTVMETYLRRFGAGVSALGGLCTPTVSQSAGGLLSLPRACDLPVRTALSGPAAGVVGAAHRARQAGYPDVITIDVGGTSTDVSLVVDGEPARVPERPLAGYPLRMPTLDVNAVGAGGGSIAWIDRDRLLKVGPQSAGADPGPLCYGRGGTQVTLTDANVVLGRLNGDALLDGRMRLESDRAVTGIASLASALHLSPVATALGVVRIACANMVRAIRTISVERGLRPGDFALFAFGGAGPLHAADVARELDMSVIIVPPRPGLLCAEGLLFSDLTADFVRSPVERVTSQDAAWLEDARRELLARVENWFAIEGIRESRRRIRWHAEMRYVGQNFELPVALEDRPIDSAVVETLIAGFRHAHEKAYGYASETEPVELVNLKVAAAAVLDKPRLTELLPREPGAPAGIRPVVFLAQGAIDAPVFRRESLSPGQSVSGPAVIEQLDSTTLIHPGDRCEVDRFGNLVMRLT